MVEKNSGILFLISRLFIFNLDSNEVIYIVPYPEARLTHPPPLPKEDFEDQLNLKV